MNYTEAVEDFFRSNPKAQLFPVDGNTKRPFGGNSWNNKTNHLKTITEINGALSKPDCKVGLIPASLELLVADWDFHPTLSENEWAEFSKEEQLKQILEYLSPYIPLAITPSKTANRYHLFFEETQEYGNKKLLFGDCRSGKGYVVLWEPEMLRQALEKRDGSYTINIEDFYTKKSSATSKTFEIGNRNNQLYNSLVVALTDLKNGYEGGPEEIEEIKKIALESGLGADEIERTLQSADDFTTQEFDEGRLKKFESRANKRNKKFYQLKNLDEGTIVINDLNVESFYSLLKSLNCDIVYNNFKGKIYTNIDKKINRGSYTPLQKQDRNILRTLIELNHKIEIEDKIKSLRITDDSCSRYIDTIARMNVINPPLDYITDLQECETEVTCENWLIKMYGIEDSEYNRWASSLVFISAIHRLYSLYILTPKRSVNVKPTTVLVGEADSGKSTLVKHLLPIDLREYHTDGLSFEKDDKGMEEIVKEKLIAEIPEIGRVLKKDLPRVKAFISQANVSMRLAYRENADDIDRKAALIATTNDDDFVAHDKAMMARLVPIELPNVSKKNAKDNRWIGRFLDEHRDSIWLSARKKYEEGVRPDMPEELKEIHDEIAKKYQAISPAQEVIDEIIRKATELSNNYSDFIKTAGEWMKHYQIEHKFVTSNSLSKEMIESPDMITHPPRAAGRPPRFSIKKQEKEYNTLNLGE